MHAQQLLVALAVIVAAAQVGGVAARRIGQPPVLGQITAGILLGPSALGAVWPAATEALFPAEVLPLLGALASIGLVLFMFLVGLELDLAHLRGQGRRAVAISHASIVVPFASGFGLGLVLHPRLGGEAGAMPFALFIGAAMAVTAFPVLARILQETGLASTKVGTTVLACAAVDDVTAWCILAVVVAVASGTGMGAVALTLAGAVAFGVVVWFVVRPLLGRLREVPIGLALALAFGGAWATEQIGVHAIFGAFAVGAAMPRSTTARLVISDRLEVAVGVLLLPVFFMTVGVSTRIGTIDSLGLWAVTLLVVAVASVGKLAGAGVAARLTGSTWRESAVIGVLMNTRGLTEIVILTVGLERGIIGPTMFTIMVIMALATTYLAVPVLRRLVPTAGGLRRSRRDRPGAAPV